MIFNFNVRFLLLLSELVLISDIFFSSIILNMYMQKKKLLSKRVKPK